MSSEDIQMITEILSGYINANNDIRKAAEQKLNELRNNLGAITYCLLSVTSSQSLSFILKKTSLVLLREILVKDYKKNTWTLIQPNLKHEIKAISLKLLLQEADIQLKQHYCEVISQLIVIIEITEETWPEIHQLVNTLLNHTYDLSSSTDVIQLKTLLILLESSANFFTEEIDKVIDRFFSLIRAIFSSRSVEVKVLCSGMLKEYIVNCDINKDNNDQLLEFILNIFQLGVSLFNSNDEEKLADVILILIEIAEEQGCDLSPYFKDILSFESLVTKKNSYNNNEKVRESAFELIATIIEQDYSIFQDNKEYLRQFIYDLYNYAFDIPRVIPEEWKNPQINSNQDTPVIAEDNLRFVQETIERLQIESECECVEIVLESIRSMFNKETDDWIYKYIGLISFSHIICYIEDITLIEKYLPFIYTLLVDSNCKIRYAAANCIDQIAESFSPIYQNTAGNKPITLLISIAFQEKVPVVQCKLIEALSTFISYIKTPEVLSKDNIMQNLFDFLFQLFSRTDIGVMIRTQILECNINLIEVVDELCAPYANTVLQILTQYFALIYKSQSNRYLYGLLLDNITLMGTHTESTYTQFIPDIIKAIIEIIEALKDNINPIRSHIQNAIERIIPITQAKFPEKIPMIILCVVMLLKTASSKLKQDKIAQATEKSQKEKEEDDSTEKSEENSLDRDDLVDFVIIIETLVTTLEANFAEYYNEIENYLLEILEVTEYPKLMSKICVLFTSFIYNMNDEVMKKEKGRKYIEIIITLIKKEIYFQNTASLLSSMKSIIRHAGEIYSKEEMHQLFEMMLMLFDKYNTKRVELGNKQGNSSKSYEEIMQLNQINNELKGGTINTNVNEKTPNAIYTEVGNKISMEIYKSEIKEHKAIQKNIVLTLGEIIDTYKKDSAEIANVCLTKIIPQYIKDNTSDPFIQLMMVFLIDDLIEYLGPSHFSKADWSLLYSLLIDSITKFKDFRMIRAVSYGIGVYAKVSSQEVFNEIALSALKLLFSLSKLKTLMKTTKKKKKYHFAKDNITAAFGKIMKYQSNSASIGPSLPSLLVYWINSLPIQVDPEEMDEQHDFMCDLVIHDHYSMIKGDQGHGVITLLLMIHQVKNEDNKRINRKIQQMFYESKQDKAIQAIFQAYFNSEAKEELKLKLKALIA